MKLVICGPGGVGKGTIVRELLQRDPTLWLSRSWTTREPRPGEAPDAYVFATREEFLAKVEAGGFIEHVEFLDYLQGSPIPAAPEGADIVYEIDVHGARAVSERFDDVRVIFIDAPDRQTQEDRLRERGDSPERIVQRLAKAAEEAAVAAELDSVVVINDRLDETVERIEALIATWRDEA